MYGEDGELRKGSAAPSATDSTGQPGSARERERQRERERDHKSPGFYSKPHRDGSYWLPEGRGDEAGMRVGGP